MKTLKDLEKRQESILDQLENLKIEVAKLQQAPKPTKQNVSILWLNWFHEIFSSKRHFLRKLPASVSREVLLEKLTRLLQTLAKIERLFSPKNHHYHKVRFTYKNVSKLRPHSRHFDNVFTIFCQIHVKKTCNSYKIFSFFRVPEI